jgi:hypothetical protein
MTCGHSEIRYNSCRDRHCPKCGGLDKARWVEKRKKDVLPVEYHHVVFTIPQELHPVFLANPRLSYNLLFSAAAQTLSQVAENPKNLGARIGFTAVLHTWTQLLLYHPHVHIIVPGGGPSSTGQQWVASKPGFFLPVHILSVVFRGKLLSGLEDAWRKGKLQPPAGTQIIEILRAASRKNWMVYSKPPMAGPEQVIDYLSRYTHRIAISNDRLVSMDGDQLTFGWKDRAHDNRSRKLTLPAVDFLQRFLLHVLPRGLVRIRHYGFLANAVRRREIDRCRDLLDHPAPALPMDPPQPETWQQTLFRITGKDITCCPRCKTGRMTDTAELPRATVPWRMPGRGMAS